jgi:hypothetical protein
MDQKRWRKLKIKVTNPNNFECKRTTFIPKYQQITILGNSRE